jgi:hypothetical protein
MLRPLLGRKSRRAVPSTRHVSHPNRTIEQRLGAFSGPTSLLGIESFKLLVVRLGLSGASPPYGVVAARSRRCRRSPKVYQ